MLKKSSLIISFLLLGAIILAACGGSSSNSSQSPVGTTLPNNSGLTTGTPSALTPAAGSELTTGTPAAGAMATQTQTTGSSGTTTQTPAAGANTTTTPAVGSEVTATPTTSGSGALPQSGTSQYALLSNILQSRVQDQTGKELGSVNGVIIDRSTETSGAASATVTATPSSGNSGSSASGTVSTSVSPRISFVIMTASGTANTSSNSNNSVNSTVTATPSTAGNASGSTSNANGQVLVPWQAFKVSGSGSVPSSSTSNSGSTNANPTATVSASNNNSATGSIPTMSNVVLVLTVDSNALASAPAFDASAFKGVVASDVTQYWASKNLSIPATGGAVAGTNVGTSVLIRGQIGSLNINDPDGKALGQVRDFIVDTTTGNIVYAILSGGSAFGGNLFVVPMSVMVWQNGQGQGVDLGTFQLSVPSTSFSTAPFIKSLESLNLNSADWKAKIDAFWNSLK